MSRKKRNRQAAAPMVQPSAAPVADTNTPAPSDPLSRVVMAGQRLLYDPKTFPILKQGITKQAPTDDILATETAGLVKLLDERSQGQIPKNLIAPAAMLLLFEIAKFMTQVGLAKPDEAMIKSAVKKCMHLLAKLYGGQKAPPGPAAPAQAAPTPAPAPAGLMEA